LDIENFPLAWRWTQASHALFPRDVLARLKPLSIEDADRLYRRGEMLFARDKSDAVIHHPKTSAVDSREWLKTLPIPPGTCVCLGWNRQTALSLPWEVFVEHWDDFCYPSSDDAFLFADGVGYALAWSHEGLFRFVGDAV
jgi:hypothetical protein